MKALKILACMVVVFCAACSRGGEDYPHSLKGYELYSWKVATDWNYTLITGTNRVKTFAEVSSETGVVDDHGWTKITLRGSRKAAQALTRLPKGESVVWACPAGQGYSWPDDDAVAEISGAAKLRGLDFRLQR